MIGALPPALPERRYFDYAGQSVRDLPEGLLARRNPFAQSSVSALKDVSVCRRKAFLKNIVGMREPEHPTATVGKSMHAEVEAWHKGALLPDGSRGPAPGPFPTHPSLVAAIEADLLPRPSASVLSEEQFWCPTGVSTPDSPDGQVWLKGFLDLVVRHDGGAVTILDMKTKGNVNACTRYALTPEEMLKDPQMGLYGHVFHGSERVQHLVVGHVYLVRDPAIPYARQVPVTLTSDVARRTYLRLLSAAEQVVEDARCKDWRGVPGNHAKCERPFKCPFIPLCHGKENTEVVNPYANNPVVITPPDAAPPGVAPETKDDKKMATSQTDLDSILAALVKKPAPAAAPVAAAPSAPAPTAPPPAAPAPKATPVPASAGGDAGDPDAGALDAMLSTMKKGAKKAKPADAAPASKPVEPPPAPQPVIEQKPVEPPPAPKPAPTPVVEAKPTEEGFTPPRKPVSMLLVHATTSAPGALVLAELIAHADAAVVDRHNKKPGVVKIESMYQLDHGTWRGDFVAMLTALVRTLADKHGALVICATGDSPATSTAVETLTGMAGMVVWGVR